MSDLIGDKSILHKVINFLGQEVQLKCCNHFSEKIMIFIFCYLLSIKINKFYKKSFFMNNIKFGLQKKFTQQFLPQYYLRK